jgi:hypothetical protein
MMARFFLHSRLHDINAGCRGFRKEHVEKLAVIKHRINFIGPELYTRARLHDLKSCEIAVRHAPRETGASSHPWKKIPREVWQVLKYLACSARRTARGGQVASLSSLIPSCRSKVP